MGYYQFLLSSLCGIFFVLFLFYLLKSIFVYKTINKYFYFSGLCLGGLGYVFFQLMLTFPHEAPDIIIFHRLKLIFAGVAFIFFLLCIDEIFFTNKILSYSYMAFFALFFVFFFLPSFTTYPIRVLMLGNGAWEMNVSSGTVGPAYYVFGITMLLFMLTCSLQFLFSSLPLKTKIYASLLAFPVLIGAANDYAVIKGFYENIFLTELNVLIFILGLFFNFLAQEQKDNAKLKKLNINLEQEVENRTKELYQLNDALKLRNSQLIKDLEVARKFQLSFIPTQEQLPKSLDLHVVGDYFSVEHVGGDLYDVMELYPGVYGFLMADVSGHGVPAAMITTMVKLYFNAHAKKGLPPGEVCAKVNNHLLETMGYSSHYLTAFFGVLHVSTGKFSYACAGHVPPLIFRAKTQTCEKITAKGVFIGIFKDSVYETQDTFLEPQDRLFLFTDGVIEIRSNGKSVLNYEYLEEFLKKSHQHSLTVQDALNHFIEELKLFRETAPVKDDQAILFLEYKPQKKEEILPSTQHILDKIDG